MLKLIFLVTLSSFSFADMSLVDYMNQPAKPIDAKITINSEHSISGSINELGGTLQLETSDGSIFRLTVPAGALPRATTLTISELNSFEHSELIYEKPHIGVQLSPNSLLFAKPVLLNIQPKTPIELSSFIAMTADHDGKDVRAAAMLPASTFSSKNIVLSLNHFSPYVITGSENLRETILKAFNRIAASRLEAWTADQILKMKQGQTTDPDFFQKTLNEGFEKIVKVHANSVETCEGGIAAQRMVLGWMRQCELLGADQSLATENFKSSLVSKTAKLCRDRVKKACYEDHRVFDVIRFAISVERQAQLMGIDNDPNAKELTDLAVRCAHFEFNMKSTISSSEAGDVKVIAESKIDFGLEHIFGEIKSKGTVQVTQMIFNPEGLHCILNSLVAPPADSAIVDFGLNDDRFDQSLGVFVRGLYPPSVGNFTCKDDSSPPNTFNISLPYGGTTGPDTSFWGGMFLALHSQAQHNEYNVKKNRYEFFKWDVLYGEKFATKEYDRALESIQEKTNMTIYHRPIQ